MRYSFFLLFIFLLLGCENKIPCDRKAWRNRKYEQKEIYFNSSFIAEIRKVYSNKNFCIYSVNGLKDTFAISNYMFDEKLLVDKEGYSCNTFKGDKFDLKGSRSEIIFVMFPGRIEFSLTKAPFNTPFFYFYETDLTYGNNTINNKIYSNSFVLKNNLSDTLCFQKDSGFVFVKLKDILYQK